MPLGVPNAGMSASLLAVGISLRALNFLDDLVLSQLDRQDARNYLATAYIAGVDGSLLCARNARVDFLGLYRMVGTRRESNEKDDSC